MAINGLMRSTIHPMHKVRARINFVTSRTFVCLKRRGEPNGLFFRGTPPNTPGEKRNAMFRVVRGGYEWYNYLRI